MRHEADSIVVGAGVVGLACARALAGKGREVIVIEAGDGIGRGTSSRSSEVIHAGLYYPPGGLKAALCVRGKHMLYEFCAARGVGHRRLGKLVVATSPGEVAALHALAWRAAENGVDDVTLLSAGAARALAPDLHCTEALLSPSTGIVDTHGLMLAIEAECRQRGGAVVLRSPVARGHVESGGLVLELGGSEPSTIKARHVVNAAGLRATHVALSIDGLDARHVPRPFFAKGTYFSLAGRAPFSRLVYPMPEPGGTGIHFTLDLAGQARFGPDVEWVPEPDRLPDHSVDPGRAGLFRTEVRKYWPGLPDGALGPAFAGIRPKISGPGEPDADFVIQTERVHGVPGLINLYGIESPGLTACLAIAERVADKV